MKYRLVMNPSSRSGRGVRLWEAWRDRLARALIPYESFVTEKQGDACRLARECEGESVVVAVGGDGTINEVLDGILQSGNPGLQMGVLYAGTSPDFCRFQRIPVDCEEALDTLLKGNITEVDVCRIRYTDEKGNNITAHFGCSSNIGMGAAVARSANQMRRSLGDTLGTGAALLKTIFSSRPADLDMIIDGEPVSLAKVNNLSVIKNPYLASGLKLDLSVRPDDGNLWVMGLYGKSRSGFLRLLPGWYTGSVVRYPGIYLRKMRTIKVTAAPRQEIEFDGDPRGRLPAEIELLPKALRLRGASYERA
ncbi:MAG TPA: diacylglycerol kinase family protein [Syntrophorhabdaceae bacterium]|nr:diacylglycerol kinase family protein [Syntrophorhabdaceae bacterium]